MADENNQQNENNQDDTNTQQNNNFGGSGKKYVVGIDTGTDDGGVTDGKYRDAVAQGIKDCGNEVVTTDVGPNQESYMQGKGADVAVFLCNGVAPATMWSFVNAIKAGSVPYTIFAIEGWYGTDPNGTLSSLEKVREVKFEPEWDADQFMNSASTAQMQSDANGATTIGEWADQNSQYFSLCYAKTPEEMAQNICSGSCGGGGSSGGTSGGGAQIKDKTFEKCIRRICAATDSIFIVENNAAVLFPYTDWLAFTLREKIQTIKPNEIDPRVFTMEYNNDGFYNKVSIAWGGATLPERFPDNELMHEAYLKRQQQKQENKTQTTTDKHGTTQTLSTDTDGTNILSEQYDILVKKYGEMEKRIESPAPDLETAQYLVNALLIQYVRDFNNTCQCRSIADRRYIGGTFYIVTNPFTKDEEMFYLNGYTIRTQKDQPIYFDLDFRYGPESAEELLDYQFYTGGAASGGEGVTGGEAADINQAAQEACKGANTPEEKMTAVHNYLKDRITYSWYECSHYKTPSECLKNIKSLNCADTSRLTRAVMSAAGLNAVVVHGDYHFWTVITINGHEYASDAVSAYHAIGDVWQPSGTGHFNNGGPYYDKCGKEPSC